MPRASPLPNPSKVVESHVNRVHGNGQGDFVGHTVAFEYFLHGSVCVKNDSFGVILILDDSQ